MQLIPQGANSVVSKDSLDIFIAMLRLRTSDFRDTGSNSLALQPHCITLFQFLQGLELCFEAWSPLAAVAFPEKRRTAFPGIRRDSPEKPPEAPQKPSRLQCDFRESAVK